MVKVRRARWVGNCFTAHANRLRRLGEIPRRFAINLAAHLGCVSHIVAPDTENAIHRIKRSFPFDRHCLNGRRGKKIIHLKGPE